MGFRCGIVGLPNVGKSTLFNALTQTSAAAAENFPFTTIEPNIGKVPVPDARLKEIARLAGSARAVPTRLSFIDIAGLVRGASRGEGLGNQFLGHIREVDAIVHVLRCFDDTGIAHVEGRIDPADDADIVETELLLADLESLERRAEAISRRARGGDTDARKRLAVIEPVLELLAAGSPARLHEAGAVIRELQLLTAKPVLYVCNVGEDAAAGGNAHSEKISRRARAAGAECVVISAAIEAEIAELEDVGERAAFIAELGLPESGLDRVIRAGYALLDLITFFTANENEAHAWTVTRGARAPEAAGRVHTDFERGFIRAETIAFDDYTACGGEHGAREAGRARLEGRDYVVRDGDVLKFRVSP